MKIAYRLSLALIALLAVVFTLGGTLLVRRMFLTSLDNVIAQSTDQHYITRYSLESTLLNLPSGKTSSAGSIMAEFGESITGYLGQQNSFIQLYSAGGELYFSNSPVDIPSQVLGEAFSSAPDGCVFRKIGGATYLLMVSDTTAAGQDVRLLSGFDASGLFAERQQHILFFFRVEAVLLAVSAVAAVFLARFITRPINRLSSASSRIASGAFEERVPATSGGEIGQLADNFNAMADTIEKKIAALNLTLRQKDDFVSAFTHEIKTPMTTLIGYADLLRTSECPPEVRQRAATAIFHESRRLEALSQKLLSLMGLDARPIVLQPVRLERVFSLCAKSLSMQQQIQPCFACPPGVSVLADEDLLVDLLYNLIRNAINAEPSDGKVHITAEPGGGRCKVTVFDIGKGIPQQELNRIMEPFYMVDKSRSRSQGGTGIGLALAQKIAALHNTRLEFTSEEDVGTAVRFYLSLEEAGV